MRILFQCHVQDICFTEIFLSGELIMVIFFLIVNSVFFCLHIRTKIVKWVYGIAPLKAPSSFTYLPHMVRVRIPHDHHHTQTISARACSCNWYAYCTPRDDWLKHHTMCHRGLVWFVLITPDLSKDIQCHDHTFPKFINHQIRLQATHKVSCQPGDCIWSLYSSSGVCVDTYGLTYPL